jgi:hypothetical protein
MPARAEENPMSVAEIESAISQLPAGELAELMAWLQKHHEQVWDRQIEEDLESGRLDVLLAEVDKQYEAGLARPL